MNQTKYLTCAETAKLIREALKESFAGVKFSVRSRTYSGGASIDIGWIDGPTAAQVDAVTGRFKGATFDGMTDCKDYVRGTLDGEAVHFGADFIFSHREYSDAMVSRILARVSAHLGGMDQPSVDDYRQGRLYAWKQSGGCDVQREVNVALSRHTFTLTKASATAARAA